MAFVNEIIPQEDREKYRIDTLTSTAFIFRWTVDRENDMWLCFVTREGDPRERTPEESRQSYWFFYWKGQLLTLWTKYLEGGGNLGEPGWSRVQLQTINIPKVVEAYRPQILQDLESALKIYKYNKREHPVYTLTLDIPLELKK